MLERESIECEKVALQRPARELKTGTQRWNLTPELGAGTWRRRQAAAGHNSFNSVACELMTPVSDRSVRRGRRHQQKWRADRDRPTQIRHSSPSEQSRFTGKNLKTQGKRKKLRGLTRSFSWRGGNRGLKSFSAWVTALAPHL